MNAQGLPEDFLRSDSVLDGKVAIVTGAGGGIGSRVADGLVAAGARVAVVDLDAAAVERVCEELPRDRVAAIPGDVTDGALPAGVCDRALELWGVLPNVLVNVAAVRTFRDFVEIDRDFLERHYLVNAVAPMQWMTVFAQRLIEVGQPGGIVNITSSVVHRSYPRNAAYASSKAALLGLSQTAAIDLAAYGIRVNCIAPGVTPTRLTEEYLSDPQRRAELEARVPMGRLGTGDDIAGAVVFFASDYSGFVTGTTLCVDGGFVTAA